MSTKHNYLDNLSTTIRKTLDKIQANVNNEENKNIVIFDIDDTLIDSSGTLIVPIADVYSHAKNLGFLTAIITARPGFDKNIRDTNRQLLEKGIRDYSFMYFLPTDRTDPEKFKLEARKNIHDLGYNIVMSIGDKPWDIGQYGGYGFIVNH